MKNRIDLSILFFLFTLIFCCCKKHSFKEFEEFDTRPCNVNTWELILPVEEASLPSAIIELEKDSSVIVNSTRNPWLYKINKHGQEIGAYYEDPDSFFFLSAISSSNENIIAFGTQIGNKPIIARLNSNLNREKLLKLSNNFSLAYSVVQKINEDFIISGGNDFEEGTTFYGFTNTELGVSLFLDSIPNQGAISKLVLTDGLQPKLFQLLETDKLVRLRSISQLPRIDDTISLGDFHIINDISTNIGYNSIMYNNDTLLIIGKKGNANYINVRSKLGDFLENRLIDEDGERSFYYSISGTDDGGYILCGGTTLGPNGGIDIKLLRLDTNFNYVWHKYFGGSTFDIGHNAIQARDGSILCVGIRQDLSRIDSEIYVIKTCDNAN